MKHRPASSLRHTLFAACIIAALLIGTPAVGLTDLGSSATSVSKLPDSATDIRDIRGPIALSSPSLWSVWLAGSAVLGLVAFGAWRWILHRQCVAAVLPFELALRRLRASRELMQPSTVREFSITVSDIVRVYIEERFQLMAAHRTTEEFLHDLLEYPDESLTRHRALLVRFLYHGDLAKYGGWTLSAEEMETMYESARIFIAVTGKHPDAATPRNMPFMPSSEEPHDSLSAA